MSTSSLFLLAPLALFLVAMLLWRISPLRAMAAGSARWLVFPAFTLFILLIVANNGIDPALRSPGVNWLMPGLGFALSIFPALPKALVPRLALREGVFSALGLMLMSLGLLL
ncbi:hypothetical protein ACKC5O_11275 [Aeromonas schubertii]|uniref:Uncharacterized protein n=2 Tax=Aeromonas TaxID=642 RepID=A0A0S2SMV9_9GAMM|nr:hypothetical protein [Aeromonas schubertii]ALP43067.1 hypothetical protein WL1483_3648 [Aeromonas schubertii]KUE79453.1 hypothetical protein ATO46_05385 [Aeromonas schubertii]MBZ6066740.1 hypothetical protein [Aeromonas schubertii]MBZ6072217.1 hypothetical protein [Aeromonas schubertii]QCG49129.1 hypothetical protein E2P79_16055 [Aeromonas schubertii]